MDELVEHRTPPESPVRQYTAGGVAGRSDPCHRHPAAGLWAFTLEDDGPLRKLTSHGVSWRGHTYIAAWMTGQTGRQVRVRYMPHHDHEIEICDARGRHLAPATSPTRPALSNCRRCAKPVRSALGASAPTRRPPIACAASDSPPPPARSPPSGWEPYSRQAERELAAADHTDVARLALPDLIPPAHRPHTGAPRPL